MAGWRRCLAVQQFACMPERIGTLVIGEQAVMADPVEAAWMDMQEEASDELIDGQGHGCMPRVCGLAVILPLEGHAAVVAGDETAVGDGHAMGISREIGEHGVGAGEGTLGINDPLDVAQWFDEGEEVFVCAQYEVLAKEM